MKDLGTVPCKHGKVLISDPGILSYRELDMAVASPVAIVCVGMAGKFRFSIFLTRELTGNS